MNKINKSVAQAVTSKQLQRALQGTGLRLFSVGINMVIAVLAARLLGHEGFGEYIVICAGAALLATVLSVGMPTLLSREIAILRGNRSGVDLPPIFHVCFATHIGITLAIGVAAILGMQSLTLMLLFSLSIYALSLGTNIYSGVERVLAAQWITTVICPLFLIVGFIFLNFIGLITVRTAILLQALVALAGVAILLLLWRGPVVRSKLHMLWTKRSFSSYIRLSKVGVTFALSQVMINGMTQIDLLLLRWLRSPEEVAWYYAAARAAFVVSFFFGAITKLAEPQLVRLVASKESSQVKRVVADTALLGLGMSVVAAICAILLARPYLHLFGESYLKAFPAMVILTIGMLVSSAMGPAEALLRAARADVNIMLFAGIALLAGLATALALIPMIGMLGAAISTATQFIVFMALQARAATIKTGFNPTFWNALRTKFSA